MGANQSSTVPGEPPPPGNAGVPRHRAQLIATSGLSPRASLRPELSRTGVIKNSVNVRKSSVKVSASKNGRRELSFSFDSSVDTRFKIYLSCNEFLNEKKFPIFASELPIIETHAFVPGLDQKHHFEIPDVLPEYDTEARLFPVIIETEPLDENAGASQLTFVNVKDGKASVVKQKLRYGDRGYELHEIFGIERQTDKSPTSAHSQRQSMDLDDINGTDCVICLTNSRDTTIIPCLHLCLCSQCAQVLSLNTRKCPVCRSPVTGMLQIDRDMPPPSPKSPSKMNFDQTS